MDLKLDGRPALVCGASQGLGLAIAEVLAEEGCRVGLLARNAAKLEAHARRLTEKGLKAEALPADMGDWASIATAISRFGSPLIVVCNTGGPPPVAATETDPALWRGQFEAMVLNQMRLVTQSLPAMRAAHFGRILNIASTSIIEPIASLPISGALRAALANWLKTLSDEVAAFGITVNTLLPGSIATDRVDSLNRAQASDMGISVEQVIKQTSAAIPAGRYGTPREFASVAAFLASPLASYVTGSLVRIDGGAMRSL